MTSGSRTEPPGWITAVALAVCYPIAWYLAKVVRRTSYLASITVSRESDDDVGFRELLEHFVGCCEARVQPERAGLDEAHVTSNIALRAVRALRASAP